MSKGQAGSSRDIELLGVLASGDSSRFEQLVARLQYEARQIVGAVLDEKHVDEAVSKAVDKAKDWLVSDAPFKVNHPSGYAKRLARNAVIDFARTCRGEALSEKEEKEIGTWIEGDWDAEDGRMGWSAIKAPETSSKAPTFKEYGFYIEHPWLVVLLRLPTCESWQDQLTIYNYLCNKLVGTGNRATSKLEYKTLKSQQDERWKRYKLITALIEGIEGFREQEVVKRFLWGLAVTDIAKVLDVSKPYVSKVVHKWLGLWGWDRLQVEKARALLLTHSLARAYISFGRKGPTGHLRRDEALGVELYNRVLTAPETKAYFANLKESEALGLLRACQSCHFYWYEKIENLYRDELDFMEAETEEEDGNGDWDDS